jgi:hypothetical protein
MVAFLVVSILLGILLSLAAVALADLTFRRRVRGREVGRMLAYALVENVGYRQLVSLWRTLALVDLIRRKKGWGAQRRRGIGSSRSVRRDGGLAGSEDGDPGAEMPHRGRAAGVRTPDELALPVGHGSLG